MRDRSEPFRPAGIGRNERHTSLRYQWRYKDTGELLVVSIVVLRETTTYGGLKGCPPYPPRQGIRDKRGSLQQGAPGGNSHVLKRMYRDKFNIRRRYVDFARLQRTKLRIKFTYLISSPIYPWFFSPEKNLATELFETEMRDRLEQVSIVVSI